jgi:sugar PTS system EIIA component
VTLQVTAPLPGRALPLADVPDPMFAAAMVGPGMAIDPQPGPVEAVAPVDGVLVKLHPHAFVIEATSGVGVLVHLGIDTVQLKGEGFTLRATEGDDVRVGDPIVAWNGTEVTEGGRSPICPVVALDAEETDVVDLIVEGTLEAGDPIFTWK